MSGSGQRPPGASAAPDASLANGGSLGGLSSYGSLGLGLGSQELCNLIDSTLQHWQMLPRERPRPCACVPARLPLAGAHSNHLAGR